MLGGCATAPVYVAKEVPPLQRVAVLPMANETNDLDGPVFVRKLIQEALAARGLALVPLDQIDAILKDNGFTDGGQLRAAAPADLGKWLSADTLLYTSLVEFNYINVGFYWQRKVELVGRLVRAETGERLWETQRGWATRWVETSEKKAKDAFARQLAIQAVEKMTKMPLGPESREAVRRLLDTIPYR